MKDKNKTTHILVTGGAGFIGSHLVDRLLESGYQVKVIDNLVNGKLENLTYANTFKSFSFIDGDIRNIDDINIAMKNVDYVFHLACLGVRHSIHSPYENHEVNAEGTIKLLDAAKNEGIKHFFYISTSEIYGRTSTFPITEKALTNPLTVYGASKLAGEHYTLAYYECFQLPVTVFRIFNNYGPRAHYEGDAGEIIPRSIVRALYNEQPIIFGDGSITRDFYYVKDTANSLLTFLKIAQGNEHNSITSETYNIGTGKEISMKSLLELILVSMDKDSLGIKFMPDRPADVPRLWVDTNKFKTLADFQPKFDLSSGMKETIEYYSEIKSRVNLIKDIKVSNWIK